VTTTSDTSDTGPAGNGAEGQDHGPAEGAQGDRLDRLEQRIETIAHAVERLLPGSHGEAQQRTEDRLDRPTDVQQQVRAELERRDRVAAEQAAADTERKEREDLKTQVARLSEQPPQPPVPRRTRLLGWGE
jgi:hypothetical protein